MIYDVNVFYNRWLNAAEFGDIPHIMFHFDSVLTVIFLNWKSLFNVQNRKINEKVYKYKLTFTDLCGHCVSYID